VDSALQALVHQEILASSPALAAADSRITSATALRRAVVSAPATSLSAAVEDVPDGVDILNAGDLRLTLERDLFTAGRRRAAGGLAQAARTEATLRRRALAERVVAEADRRLVDWLSGLAALARLGAEDSLLAAAEEALTVRFAAGAARYGDVLRLRTERLRVRTEAAAVRRAAAEGRVRLGALAPGLERSLDSSLVGVRLDSLAAVVGPAPALDTLIARSARAELLETEMRRAEALREVARAEGRPRVTAGVGAQRFEGEAGDHVVGAVLGASVWLPFTSGRARARLMAAEAEVSHTKAARAAALVELKADMATARANYESAREQVAVYDTALLAAARLEREAALGAYRSGQLSLIELLDFERALARAEISRLRSLMEAAHAWAALFTGGDQLDEPTAELLSLDRE
jgi:cobalt-zinc-cadmium efflux system outer membrane protein